MNLNSKLSAIHQARLFLSFLLCVTFLAAAQIAIGQTTGSATLRGTVKDPQGALVRGATVTLTNERTKDDRKAITKEDGSYSFTALSPGDYSLKVEASGFKTVDQSHVSVETS